MAKRKPPSPYITPPPTKRKPPYINPPPDPRFNPRLASREEIKREFSRRLSAMMSEKGLSNSALARKAFGNLEDGSARGRDNIGMYIHGMSLPQPHRLAKLVKALGCEIEDLMPVQSMPSVGPATSPFSIVQLPEDPDRCVLRVNQEVSLDTAVAVRQLLKEDQIDVDKKRVR